MKSIGLSFVDDLEEYITFQRCVGPQDFKGFENRNDLEPWFSIQVRVGITEMGYAFRSQNFDRRDELHVVSMIVPLTVHSGNRDELWVMIVDIMKNVDSFIEEPIDYIKKKLEKLITM